MEWKKRILTRELEDVIILAKRTRWEEINKLFKKIAFKRDMNRFRKHENKGSDLRNKRNSNDERINAKSRKRINKIKSIMNVKKMIERNEFLIEVPKDFTSKYKDIQEYIFGKTS